MKKWMVGATAVAVMALTLSAPVDAKRMGGGGSFGKQSPAAMQRSATPPTAPNAAAPAAAPASSAVRQPAAGAAATQSAAQSARSRWMGPLAGIAAGLGLAWLAHSLGFGEELATALLIGLVVMAALALFAFLRARRAGAGMQPALAGQRAGAGGASLNRYTAMPPAAGADPGTGSFSAGAQPQAAPISGGLQVPAGFDADGFVRNAKAQFIRLQAAYDSSSLDDLREFTTDEMFGHVKDEIAARGTTTNVTEVVTLDAELLGVESDAVEHTASVRFTGLIREAREAQPEPFDEVWNLTRPVSGQGGWVLAGIQQTA